MSPQDYIARVIACGLLSADELKAAFAKLPAEQRPKDVAQLGRLLVQKGLLTRYQAAAVFQGNTRSLVLGNYVVLDKIGAGGMGEVFKARHRVMERIVAIKVLPAALVDSPEAVKRFHREVRSAARLIHPNIVTAFDAAEDKGIHFLAMEYVEGEDLAKIVDREGPLAIADAVDYTLQAAEGLAYAHAQGMTHRDIKPHNLLLASGGRKSSDAASSAIGKSPVVKILDMGLARFESSVHGQDTERLSITREDQIVGTVDYMSPEQAESNKSADHRSDIYSLGCTLYRLVTGQVPFGGDTAIRKLIAHRESPIPSLLAARPDAPAGLQAVYARMLAKRAADRFQSMTEVIAALRPFSSAGGAASVADASDDGELVDEDSELFNFIQKHPTSASSRIGSPGASGIARPAPAKSASGALAAAAPAPRKPSIATPTATLTTQQVQQDTGEVEQTTFVPRARKKKLPLGLIVSAAALIGVLLLGGAVLTVLSLLNRPTKLVIAWPVAERTSGQLLIGGQEIELSDAEPLEIEIEPGTVVLSARRRGYEPIDQEFAVAAGEARSVPLQWIALPTFGNIGSSDPTSTTPLTGLGGFADIEKLNAAWPALFKAQQDKLAALALQRAEQLASVRSAIAAAQGKAGDAPETLQALQAAQDFLASHGGTPEAAQLGGELEQLASPADTLARADIAPYELAAAGGGNPADAAAQLVAVLGDSHLQCNDQAVLAIAYARDNRTVATAGRSREICLFDAQTKEQRLVLRGHSNEVRALAFSPVADLLASGSLDHRIKLWDTKTGQNTLTLFATDAMEVNALVFSPDGRWLASASSDKIARIWNVATGQCLQELPTLVDNSSLVSLAVSSDGKWLATGAYTNVVKIWNTVSWSMHAEINAGGSALALAFHPTKAELIGGIYSSGQGTLKTWDFSGNLLRSLDPKSNPIVSLQFDPTGSTLVHMQGSQCRVWNYDARTVSVEFSTPSGILALAPDGKTIATCGADSGDVRLWNLSGQSLYDRMGHAGGVISLDFSPDGRRLVSCGFDKTVRIWDIATRELLHTLRSHSQHVGHCVFSHDGKFIASASQDYTARIWNAATLQELAPLLGPKVAVSAVQFSPDDALLATSHGDGCVRLWDANTGVHKRDLFGLPLFVADVVFSPDGAWIAAGASEGQVRLWSTTDDECRLYLQEQRATVRVLVFSPDGRWLALAGDDQNIVLIELATGKKLAALVGHSASIRSLAFSPDGKTLVSTAATPIDKRGEVMIWDVDSQTARVRLSGPLGEVYFAAVDPLGRYIATAHRNGTIAILRAKPR